MTRVGSVRPRRSSRVMMTSRRASSRRSSRLVSMTIGKGVAGQAVSDQVEVVAPIGPSSVPPRNHMF